MLSKLALTALSAFALASSAMAQATVTVAVDELSSDDSLVPYRKLLTEYTVTELAACNLIKVVGYDKVNAAKGELKLNSLQQADAKSLDALLKKLGVDAVCFGSLSRADGGAVKADAFVFKGDVKTKLSGATLKSIESTDDASKKLAAQVESVVKGIELKVSDDASPDSGKAGQFIVPGASN